jgi:hypothetical protein
VGPKKNKTVGLLVYIIQQSSLAIMFVFSCGTNCSDRKTSVFFFTNFCSMGVGGTHSVLACRLCYYTIYPAYLSCYLDAKTIFPLSHPTRKLSRGALLFSMLPYICSRVVQIKLHSQFFRAYNFERIIEKRCNNTHCMSYSISSYRLRCFASLVFVAHMLPVT